MRTAEASAQGRLSAARAGKGADTGQRDRRRAKGQSRHVDREHR